MADFPEENACNEKSSSTSQKVLFVRNLPFSTTDSDLQDLFSEIGPVKRCFVIRNKGVKGECRGFGYVTFALSEDAEKAIYSVKRYKGRQLSICFANKKPRHEKRKFEKVDKTEVDNYDENNPDKEDSSIKDIHAVEEEPPTKKLKDNKNDKKSTKKRKPADSDIGRTVVIMGFAAQVNRNHIRKRCRKIGTVEKVTFPVEGHQERTAFVVYESHKDSREAVRKLHGKTFKGNTITVSLLSREGKLPSQKSMKKSKVIVRNLPFKCKEEDLRKHFSQFGEITEVCIPTKIKGEQKQSRGFGFVQFSNVFQAGKAIEGMNTKEIFGRAVAVDWAVSKATYENIKASRETIEKGGKDAEADLKEEEQDTDNENSENSGSDSGTVGERASSDDDDSEGDTDYNTKTQVEEKKTVAQAIKQKRPSDVKEGKTLFIRNLSFESTEEALCELFEQFGEVAYCRVLEDSRTGRNRGMGFVKFKSKESAEECLAEASKEGSGLCLDGFTLNLSMAVTPGKAKELAKEKKVDSSKDGRDSRNLYLAREGVILPGSAAAEGLSKSDLLKRQKAEAEKKVKLSDPNIFVSQTRLCVRNVPLKVDDKKLKEIFSSATGKKVHVQKVLIMRSKDRVDSSGLGRSLGYGFVEFVNHRDALAALRATNNNPALFGPDRRPIVEFSLENSLALKAKQRRLQKGHTKQRQSVLEHAPGDQPKTNKERRIEMNMKRREKRQRKRQEKRKAKLEQVNASDSFKTNTEEKEADTSRRRKEEKSKKAVREKDKKFGPNKSSEKGQSQTESLSTSLEKINRKAAKTPDENKNTPSDNVTQKRIMHKAGNLASLSKDTVELSATNRKRKGVRKQEREKKDEFQFAQLVAKYKNRFFGANDEDFASKRARWFE